MHQLMGELGYEMPGPSLLRMDNQSAIAVNKNPEHHAQEDEAPLTLPILAQSCSLGWPDCPYLCEDSGYGCLYLHQGSR